MTERRVNVKLSDRSAEALDKVVAEDSAAITEVVNAGILLYRHARLVERKGGRTVFELPSGERMVAVLL